MEQDKVRQFITEARKSGQYTDEQIVSFLQSKGVTLSAPQEKSNAVADFAKGAVKGLTRTAVGTARLLEGVGQRTIAALTPYSYEEVKARGSISEPSMKEAVDTALAPKNTAEKVGGIAADVGTFFAPLPKASVAGGAVRSTKAIGERLYGSAVRPTVEEGKRILAHQAKNPFVKRAVDTVLDKATPSPNTRASTALKYNIAGTETMIGVQAKRVADSLWTKEIAPAVKKSKAIVTKEELFAPILERINATVEPGKRQGYERAFRLIQGEYNKVKSFTLEDAQKVKSQIDKFTPGKLFKGEEVSKEYAVLKNDLADAIRAKTYSSLEDVNIRQKYLDWANLHELQKVGVKAITSSGKQGGFGNFWMSMWDMATTPVKSVGGLILYRVGDKLEFVGPKGVKKFGEYLQTKGITR